MLTDMRMYVCMHPKKEKKRKRKEKANVNALDVLS
jgi:hypothetical protein